MFATPEEAANSSNGPEKAKWLLDKVRTPREILRYIATAAQNEHYTHLSRHTLNVITSEIAEASSKRLEKYSATLERLTGWLVLFTIGLFVLTGVLVAIEVFPKH